MKKKANHLGYIFLKDFVYNRDKIYKGLMDKSKCMHSPIEKIEKLLEEHEREWNNICEKCQFSSNSCRLTIILIQSKQLCGGSGKMEEQ